MTSPTANQLRASMSLQKLKQTWDDSDISGGVTITLVNGAAPIPVGGATSGDYNSQVLSQPTSQIRALRDTHQADIVIFFFSAGGNQCGSVSVPRWTQTILGAPPPMFVPTNGLDTRGWFDSYLANVNTASGGPCANDQIAAHEFGHLLGGGHADLPPFTTFDPWLFPDSRAYVYTETITGGSQNNPEFTIVGYKTALASDRPLGCALTLNKSCANWIAEYSTNAPDLGNDDRENALTLSTTGLSVANYWRQTGGGGGPLPSFDSECTDGVDNDGDGAIDFPLDTGCSSILDDDETDTDTGSGGGDDGGLGGPAPPPPPPPCDSTVQPAFVTASFLYCTGSLTYYQVAWLHACPSQVDTYSFVTRQPNNIFATWLVNGFPTLLMFQDWWVVGATTGIRVRSCGPAGCSNYSNEVGIMTPSSSCVAF
ncbi:MAG: hypothetical protein AAFR75_00030 [Pseudomonadota bacterium]